MGNHPLVYVGIFALAIFGMVVVISALTGLSVAVAARFVGKKNANKYQKELRSMLPGKNCGQCGCEDCDGFAQAVLYGAAAESACPYGDEELPQKLIDCVGRLHKQMEDPTPPKPKKDRILGIWDKKR